MQILRLVIRLAKHKCLASKLQVSAAAKFIYLLRRKPPIWVAQISTPCLFAETSRPLWCRCRQGSGHAALYTSKASNYPHDSWVHYIAVWYILSTISCNLAANFYMWVWYSSNLMQTSNNSSLTVIHLSVSDRNCNTSFRFWSINHIVMLCKHQ